MHIKSQNWLCKRYLWWICEFMLTNMTRTWNYPNSFFSSWWFQSIPSTGCSVWCSCVQGSGWLWAWTSPCCSITSGGTNCSSLTSTYIWNIKMGHGNNSPSLFLPQVFPPSCRRVWGYVWSSECDECRHSELLPKRVLVQARLLPSLLFLLSVQVNPPQS